MSLAQTAEQELFATSLHDVLSGADVPAAARRWAGEGPAGQADQDAAAGLAHRDPAAGLALWRKLAGLGVTALAVPERHGGLGASLLDVVIACEELGHHAMPGPVAESLVAVPQLLAGLAAEPLAATARSAAAGWLAGLAAGDLIATMARPPHLPYAADADVADLVLLADGDAVWLAEAGTCHRSVDQARSLWEVQPGELLARGPAVAAAVARALDAGTLACAAQLLGAGRALLEESVRHATRRTQFGRPVGSFQAVKHRLADVAISLEFARPLLSHAAITLSQYAPTAARDVSAAKVAATDAATRAARAALQVHGAIGYTREHDLHLWLTKVQALKGAWGSQAGHRARVLAAITGDQNAARN
jgi:alkylation response protein AidB-like acyl-CoA dehydrogenase